MPGPTVGNTPPDVIRSGLGELISEITVDQHQGVPLGTAQWMGLREAKHRYGMRPDNLSEMWIGEAFNDDATALGYSDDRHVTLVAGTRGGKGAGVIIPNLCHWPGSCFVIDPKGMNATITARRRGNGSDYARGLGQEVRILDPFNQVQGADDLKARFNPLDLIDVNSDLAVDDAGRVATSIMVMGQAEDPFWEESAQNLLSGLILHVLTFPSFKDIRNLVTVRRLLTEGDWLTIEAGRALGREKMPTPFNALWNSMISNKAFDNVISGIGTQMASMADKTLDGVMQQARTNTAFLAGAPMRRQVEKSDFDLGSIKTSARGLNIYLVLPTRYEEHFRWLRLMVTLAIGEMERIQGPPRTGHQTLFLLDEFPGLKRMTVIEKAVAQTAEFGVKFFFVAQNLAQLKTEYGDAWETFVSNSGLKIFLQIDDQFTQEYLSKQLGEREVRRQTLSGSDSSATAITKGDSETDTLGRAPTVTLGGPQETLSLGAPTSKARGISQSRAETITKGGGWADGVHKRPLLSPDEIRRYLSRIDDKGNPAYPGIIVALMPGQHPLAARRINYFNSPIFEGCFDPHPNHPPPPTLTELATRDANRKAMSPPKPAVARKSDVGPRDAARGQPQFPKKISIAACLGLVLLAGLAPSNIRKPSIMSGPAIVNAPQLHLRSCAAPTCRLITTLHHGDTVTVTQSLDNGWKGITVRVADGKTVQGFVNGDFLSRG